LNIPAISSDSADPDGDGVVNILEYGLGGDPLTADASVLPRIGTIAGRLTLSFQRDASLSDLTYTVQETSTLGTPDSWIDIATGTNGATMMPLLTRTAVSETAGTGAYKNVEVRDAPLSPEETQRFLRLKISH